MIWRTQLPWKKKIGVMLMFSGGFLEMAFGIMRSISIMTVSIGPSPSFKHDYNEGAPAKPNCVPMLSNDLTLANPHHPILS